MEGQALLVEEIKLSLKDVQSSSMCNPYYDGCGSDDSWPTKVSSI